MMAAPITVTGATLEPGAPVVLFPTRIVGGGVDAGQGRQYDVAPDGRFLINTVLDERRRADHAAAELESRGDAVTRLLLTLTPRQPVRCANAEHNARIRSNRSRASRG